MLRPATIADWLALSHLCFLFNVIFFAARVALGNSADGAVVLAFRFAYWALVSAISMFCVNYWKVVVVAFLIFEMSVRRNIEALQLSLYFLYYAFAAPWAPE